MILDSAPTDGLRAFLIDCGSAGVRDLDRTRDLIDQTIVSLKRTKTERARSNWEAPLSARWYASLGTGIADYGVYAEDDYLAEVWACWVIYSRAYLRRMRQDDFAGRAGAEIRSVVDLGCGCGHTTAALRGLFPHARVIGTNVPTGKQTDIARMMGQRYGFEIITDMNDLPSMIDLVFASEYFEHWRAPVDHLHAMLGQMRPRALLVANSFGTRSIGHFDDYMIDRQRIEGSRCSRMFNSALRHDGYEKQKTTFWNGRPAYWVRRS